MAHDAPCCSIDSVEVIQESLGVGNQNLLFQRVSPFVQPQFISRLGIRPNFDKEQKFDHSSIGILYEGQEQKCGCILLYIDTDSGLRTCRLLQKEFDNFRRSRHITPKQTGQKSRCHLYISPLKNALQPDARNARTLLTCVKGLDTTSRIDEIYR
jgi:hypothetical protein